VGLVVNPVAGMGGRVGLKGTDGEEALELARRLGAEPEAPERAALALRALVGAAPAVGVLTCDGTMGAESACRAEVDTEVIGHGADAETSPDDTKAAVRAFVEAGVDLILFAGGDGTARDVLDANAERIAALGIPAGCKMHSAVFATSPASAGEAAARFLSADPARRTVLEAEVMDIDEGAYRADRLSAQLYGYLRVPNERRLMQGAKSARPVSDGAAVDAIADGLISELDDDTLYIVGPGTTTARVFERLGLSKTLLGVDAMRASRLVGRDLNEDELLRLLETSPETKMIVSVIGTQGYVLGRGNQQLSPQVIRRVGRDNLIVLATPQKLVTLPQRRLLVDTGDVETDRMLSGHIPVRTGYRQSAVIGVAVS
jgi:predicted polyphosphate/ATP-dependent NAD kinase